MIKFASAITALAAAIATASAYRYAAEGNWTLTAAMIALVVACGWWFRVRGAIESGRRARIPAPARANPIFARVNAFGVPRGTAVHSELDRRHTAPLSR